MFWTQSRLNNVHKYEIELLWFYKLAFLCTWGLDGELFLKFFGKVLSSRSQKAWDMFMTFLLQMYSMLFWNGNYVLYFLTPFKLKLIDHGHFLYPFLICSNIRLGHNSNVVCKTLLLTLFHMQCPQLFYIHLSICCYISIHYCHSYPLVSLSIHLPIGKLPTTWEEPITIICQDLIEVF